MPTFSTVPSAYSPCASAFGSASPPRFSVFTLAGMPPLRSSSAAALGTMLTCTTSSSTVASSSAFSTSTSFPPQASVPNTSAMLTSKLIEVEKSTDERSSSVTVSRSQCSRTTTDEWRIITPFGRPVGPGGEDDVRQVLRADAALRRVGGFSRDGVALAVEQQQRGRARPAGDPPNPSR